MELMVVGRSGPWHVLAGFGGRWRKPGGMDHVPVPLPFERLPDEPASDYAALLLYRDLGPGRSLSQVADVSGRSESTLRRLAKRWEWSARLEAYDARFLARAAELIVTGTSTGKGPGWTKACVDRGVVGWCPP